MGDGYGCASLWEVQDFRIFRDPLLIARFLSEAGDGTKIPFRYGSTAAAVKRQGETPRVHNENHRTTQEGGEFSFSSTTTHTLTNQL